ncbi:MAG TPA: acyltransferase [Candidatus Angelobacter sp.]|nr:acyltransferase [Candidatus Angelobacter sp.]
MPQPATVSSQAENRVQGIDILRGLCIIAVVLHHTNLRVRFHLSAFGKLLGPSADRVLFWNGYYGVIVFFVISGFLITTWSLKRWGSLRHIDRRQFYLMRFARIIPCLAGLLAILALLDRAGVPRFVINTQHTSLGRALLAALTFHINWLEAHTGYLPASWDVLWSLSVEEVFYVFFPLLCTLLRKQLLIAGAFCCFVIIGPFARTHAFNDLWADYGYLSGMDGIALGCLAAILTARIRLSGKATVALRLCGSALCLLITVFRAAAARLAFYKAGLDVTILELGAAMLLISLQQRFENSAIAGDVTRATTSANSPNGVKSFFNSTARLLFHSTAFLRWFGRNSYEVYLTHMFVLWPVVLLYLHYGISLNFLPLLFPVALALTGLLGYLVAQFYSEPLNRGIRKQFAAPSKRTAAAD